MYDIYDQYRCIEFLYLKSAVVDKVLRNQIFQTLTKIEMY